MENITATTENLPVLAPVMENITMTTEELQILAPTTEPIPHDQFFNLDSLDEYQGTETEVTDGADTLGLEAYAYDDADYLDDPAEDSKLAIAFKLAVSEYLLVTILIILFIVWNIVKLMYGDQMSDLYFSPAQFKTNMKILWVKTYTPVVIIYEKTYKLIFPDYEFKFNHSQLPTHEESPEDLEKLNERRASDASTAYNIQTYGHPFVFCNCFKFRSEEMEEVGVQTSMIPAIIVEEVEPANETVYAVQNEPCVVVNVEEVASLNALNDSHS